MSIIITKSERAAMFGTVDVLGPQVGDAVTIEAGGVSAPLDGGLYRVYANAAHTVRFGTSALANANGGEIWPAGNVEVRFVPAGGKIAVA